VAPAVAFFIGPEFQSVQMFPHGVAHQSRPVLTRALRGPVSGGEKLFVEDDLDD
jgi:hypothetical protein